MIRSIFLSQNACGRQKSALATILILISLLMYGCSATEPATVVRADMGEKVLVDGLEYTVLDATWVSTLGEGAEVRMPANEYLLVRVAVSNSSSASDNMAAFKLVAADGTEYAELADGRQVPGWMGLARSLDAGESRQGTVLFDAPRAVYQLQAADEFYDGETGSAALIHIPIRMETPGPAIPVALE